MSTLTSTPTTTPTSTGPRRRNALVTAVLSLLLALGGIVMTSSTASAYTVLAEYRYSSLSTCSLEMDRYAQRFDIIQGCTAVAWVNGKPTQWRLMIGRW